MMTLPAVMKNVKYFAKLSTAEFVFRSGLIEKYRKQEGLIILMLHKVNDLSDPLPLTISPALFERMVKEIKEHHDIIDLDDSFSNGTMEVDDGLKFAITFDDGYRDNYEHAFPILQRHNTPATIYISVDHVEGRRAFWYERMVSSIQHTDKDHLDMVEEGLGKYSLCERRGRQLAIYELNHRLKNFDDETREKYVERITRRLAFTGSEGVSVMLSWEMIKEMEAAGISIGSHTLSHAILSRESRERVRREVSQSKEILEGRLNTSIPAFAYPNGTAADFNDIVVNEIKRAGYRHAVTTIPGINRKDTDPFTLKRVNIHNDMCSNKRGRFMPSLFWTNVLSIYRRGD